MPPKKKEADLRDNRHLMVENVSPSITGGRAPVKRVAGGSCVVEADIFRDGHDVIRAAVLWRRAGQKDFLESPMTHVNNDRWRGEFPIPDNARYEFTVQAWTDGYATWLEDFRKRVEAGLNVASEALEGAERIESSSRGDAKGAQSSKLKKAAADLRSAASDARAALAVASDPSLVQILKTVDSRGDAVTVDPVLEIVADRERALVGSWYELFIRSQAAHPGQAGTFRDAENRLSYVRDLGFDVIYLTPIHPVGRKARKGPNNSLTAGPNDPGSPWAIGNETGGHTAIEPALGTLADFDRYVAKAKDMGMEIALDFAIQCSPDHPWVKEHPEWFYQRPDGTIKFAENPPKKYEDIYPLNFDSEEWPSLWNAFRDVVLFWVKHGVKIFRVDNPHTKPVRFWQWLIRDVQSVHPDVIFLAEAFTRPKVMKSLAKAGFTQSYTYFTWRNEKQELMDYLEELSRTGMKDYFRPNFFVNTPDILHEFLQKGGRPAFRLRLILAATMSPSYGIYSGYEFCENEAVPGTEEYLHSEKYEIKHRDWDKPGHIKDDVARINAIRRENPALQQLSNIRFMEIDNDQLIAYVKMTEDRRNIILVVVNLDPHNAQQGTVHVPLKKLGVPPGGRYEVTDLLTGQSFHWSAENFVRLDPASQPAHVLRFNRILS